MAGSSGDPTRVHREFLATTLRPLLETIETGLQQQGIRPYENTPAALLLEVAVNFMVGEDGGPERAINLLEDLIREIMADNVHASIY